jgi:hypothetical protein
MSKLIGLRTTDVPLSVNFISNNFVKITVAANQILVLQRFKQVDND